MVSPALLVADSDLIEDDPSTALLSVDKLTLLFGESELMVFVGVANELNAVGLVVGSVLPVLGLLPPIVVVPPLTIGYDDLLASLSGFVGLGEVVLVVGLIMIINSNK